MAAVSASLDFGAHPTAAHYGWDAGGGKGKRVCGLGWGSGCYKGKAAVSIRGDGCLYSGGYTRGVGV